MNQAQEEVLARRRKCAENIKAHPHLYKVCWGCESVVNHKLDTCIFCHAYGFDYDPAAILKKADELSNRLPTIEEIHVDKRL